MENERRNEAATALRRLFDEQWTHILNLYKAWDDDRRDKQSRQTQENQLIESFVDVTNKRLRVINNYRAKLRLSVRKILLHVDSIADAIPAAIRFSSETFATIPICNAMFVNKNDLAELFCRDDAILAVDKKFLRSEYPYIYVFLTAVKSERNALGAGVMGDMIVRDIPQITIGFSDHQLHSPCIRADEARFELKKYLFDTLVGRVSQEMAARDANEFGRRKSGDLDAMVRTLSNPEFYLNELTRYLEKPEQLLSLRTSHIRVSKLGVKLDANATDVGNEFDLYELIWNRREKQSVLILEYPRHELSHLI